MLFLGLVFGAFSPVRSWWRSRAFVVGGASAVMFTAVAAASYAVAPDWMWMYYVEANDVEWAVAPVLVAYLFVFVVGFAAAVSLNMAARRWTWIAATVCAAMEIGLISLTWDRYRSVGTAAQWSTGRAHDLVTINPTGQARTISALASLFVLVFATALFFVWKESREASADR